MSSEEIRKVSCEEIQLVQNLIENCLQLYMSQKEVVNTLLVQAKIEPGFTELVWKKLEEEHRKFFKAYHLRLIVKDQITQFNRLLETQVELMDHICPAGVHQNSGCYAPEHTGPASKPENVHQPNLPSKYPNGGSSLHQSMQNSVDMSTHVRRVDVSPNMMLAQCSNVGMIQGMNGVMIKSEAGYAGTSPYMLGTDGSILEACPPIPDASLSSFSSVDSNSRPLNEAFLDSDTPFGYLGQISQNFVLSDLTAGFSNSSDILDYSQSPFLSAADMNFLNPRRQ